MVDVGLYAAYALIAIAAIAALVFPLIYMAKHPEEAKKSGIGIVILLVVFALGYLFASGEPFPGLKMDLSSNQLKLIGAGLNTFFILAVIGVLSIIVSEVMTFFR